MKNEKQFLADVYGICDELLKNAKHAYGIDFGRLNDTLMLLTARWKELGFELSELEVMADIPEATRLYQKVTKKYA